MWDDIPYTPAKENIFHQHKNVGYTIYLSYLHPDDIKKPASDYPLEGNVFACSRDKIDPALVAPEVKAFGEYELLLDDLEFSTFPTVDNYKGAAFSSAMTFTIKEPYGMSLLEILSAMHRNDSKSRPGGPSDMNYMLAPYLITIEYAGYKTTDDNGNITKFPSLRRQIPIILREVGFNLTASGAVYSVKSIPLAESAQIENIKITETVTFKGNTVQEMLTAFMAALNAKETERYNADYKDDPERGKGPYVLHNFLYDGFDSAITNSKLVVQEVNEKGKTQLQLAPRIPMGDPKVAAQDRTKRPTITNNSVTEYTVTANQKTIPQVIQEIIMSSTWFYDNYRPKEEQGKKGREQPIVKIPKIFTYVEITDPRDKKLNNFNRIVHYGIVMHEYLSSNSLNFDNFTEDQLDLMRKHKENKTVREYNYLFTGKNIDILELDMKFNMLFYNALPVYNNRYGAGSQLQGQKKNTTFKEDDEEKNKERTTNNNAAKNTAVYGGTPGNNPTTPVTPRSGLGLDAANFYSQVRTDFERIFNSVSLVDFQALNMSIIGDPAYINDGLYRWDKFISMIKNRQGSLAVLDDGTIDWTQDVFIKLNVNRPVQGKDGSLQYVSSKLMSRTYRIQRFTHTFKGGKFSQQIVAVFTPPIPDKPKVEQEVFVNDDVTGVDQAVWAQGGYQQDDVTGVDEAIRNNAGGGQYTIVKGDQLGFIAQAQGTTVEKIREFNPQYDFAKPLQPGQVINLPPSGPVGQGSVWQGYQGNMYGDKPPRITRAGGSIRPSSTEGYPVGESGEGLV